MAYQYPYDEELRKTPLNPEMIRHQVKKDAEQDLAIGLLTGLPLVIISGGVLAFFCPTLPWDGGVGGVLLGLFFVLQLGIAAGFGVWLAVRAVLGYRRAARGAVTVEIDKLGYIEHDRPRRVYRGKRMRTVYEDFLHFASGREFRDPEKEYRHRGDEGEEFVVAVYTAEPDRILRIYRLSDYNWQG